MHITSKSQLRLARQQRGLDNLPIILPMEDVSSYYQEPLEDLCDTPAFHCVDCLRGTIFEYYMVHDDIWETYGVESGMLCITCLEARLGRILKSEDFTKVPVNEVNSEFFYKSPTLINRLTR